MNKIGIRREDKNEWERRAPLTPHHIKELKEKYGIEFVVQPSDNYIPRRIFCDDEYRKAGAEVREDLSDCDVILGVKEMPVNFFEEGKTYIFFSHTIKGQPQNMPMLKRMIELKCNLIDYEKVTDRSGKRLIYFSYHAGLAGAIDTLWILGKRFEWKGIKTPFLKIKQTLCYKNLKDAKENLIKVGEEIKKGLPADVVPFIVGVIGRGHVAQGVNEILECFPLEDVSPEDIKKVFVNPKEDRIYRIKFLKEHTVELKEGGGFKGYDHFNKNPHLYKTCFDKYLPYLTCIFNAIYWDEGYPRLITKEMLRNLFEGSIWRLEIIGDITCDIGGSVECTVKATNPSQPTFVYHPLTDEIKDGYEGEGLVILAVDNLPCELPLESSEFFSNALYRFIPDVAKADFTKSYEEIELPFEVKNAMILCHGEFTPNYEYMRRFVEDV